MQQQALNLHLEETLKLFELFDWWQPQRLADETGLKVDRIKYLTKLRKEFHRFSPPSDGALADEQIRVTDSFAQGLSFAESKAIEDLLPRAIDGDQFRFVDLFAGIGGIRKPFSQIGGRCVLTCEWDDYAQRTYRANWQSSAGHEFVSDIKEITQPEGKSGASQSRHINDRMPEHDVLLAGFPCQPFSIAGVSKKNALNRAHGFDCQDQGQLFFDICRILLVKQPPVAVLENVKNLKSHNKGNTFRVIREMLVNLPEHQQLLFGKRMLRNRQAYWIANLEDGNPDPKIIDGAHFVPQHRERVILLCVREDIMAKLMLNEHLDLRRIGKPKLRPTLKDILDPNRSVDPRYTLTPKLWKYLHDYAIRHKAKGNGFGYGMVRRNATDQARTLSARYYKDGSEILISQHELEKDSARGGRPRRLTPQECARLMGFIAKDERFKIPVSDTRAYKQFGNSVVVPVFQSIADLLRPHLDDIVAESR